MAKDGNSNWRRNNRTHINHKEDREKLRWMPMNVFYVLVARHPAQVTGGMEIKYLGPAVLAASL